MAHFMWMDLLWIKHIELNLCSSVGWWKTTFWKETYQHTWNVVILLLLIISYKCKIWIHSYRDSATFHWIQNNWVSVIDGCIIHIAFSVYKSVIYWKAKAIIVTTLLSLVRQKLSLIILTTSSVVNVTELSSSQPFHFCVWISLDG